MITVKSKDVGEVRDKFDRSVGYVAQLEDVSAEYIKRNMGDLE